MPVDLRLRRSVTNRGASESPIALGEPYCTRRAYCKSHETFRHARDLLDAVATCHSSRQVLWLEDVMDTIERRGFLKLTLGLVVATAVGAATAPSEAMPVAPVSPPRSDPEVKAEPA